MYFIFYRNLFISFFLGYIVLQFYTFVNYEHNIYYWDFVGFYDTVKNLDYNYNINFIMNSIKNDDYNVSSLVLFPYILKMFDFSRLSFIIAITVLYFIPVICIFSYICTVIIKKKSYVMPVALVIIGCCPAFWTPILRGLPDVGGLIFVLLSIIICIKKDFSILNVKYAIILGCALYAPFLLRRWYAYTQVSILISLPIFNYFIFNSRINFKKIFTLIINFIISGLCAALIMFLLQKNVIIRILMTDYSIIYQAYHTTYIDSIKRVISSTGLWYTPLLVFAFYRSCIDIKNIDSKFFFFCMYNLIFSFYLFSNTQSPSIQHVIPFAMWICFMLVISISYIMKNNKMCHIIIECFLFFTIFGNFIVFNKFNFIDNFSILFPSSVRQMQVDKYESYKRLAKEIVKLNKCGKIYILASGTKLNDSMINTLTNHSCKLSNVSHVDMRDRISKDLFLSKYIVTTESPLTHLNIDGQRVITITHDNITNKKTIGAAFNRLDYEFLLDDNIKVYFFEKKRDFTKEEINNFLDQFYIYYPFWKTEYNKTSFINLATSHLQGGL